MLWHDHGLTLPVISSRRGRKDLEPYHRPCTFAKDGARPRRFIASAGPIQSHVLHALYREFGNATGERGRICVRDLSPPAPLPEIGVAQKPNSRSTRDLKCGVRREEGEAGKMLGPPNFDVPCRTKLQSRLFTTSLYAQTFPRSQ